MPPVHTANQDGLGVVIVKPDCPIPGSFPNSLVYLRAAHRVKKAAGMVIGRGKVIHLVWVQFGMGMHARACGFFGGTDSRHTQVAKIGSEIILILHSRNFVANTCRKPNSVRRRKTWH